MAKPKGKGGSPGKPSSGGMSPGEQALVDQARESAGAFGDRPRANEAGGLSGDDTNESDPTKGPRGLVESVEESLDELHNDIQEAFSGPSQDITPPTERPDRRPLNDERVPFLGLPRPVDDEEPPIVPGDPNDLGGRGRRRRSRDDVSTSPVLRRGLLGV